MALPFDSEHRPQITLIMLGCVISAILILAEMFLPPKKLVLYPFENKEAKANPILYADGMFGGASTVSWGDQLQTTAKCEIIKSNIYPSCGMAVKFPYNKYQTANIEQNARFFYKFDLSGFDSLTLNLFYEGSAENVQFYMRNNEDRFLSIDKEKFLNVFIPTEKIKGEFQLKLENLRVPGWWIRKNKLKEIDGRNDFSQIVSIGLDVVTPVPEGTHLLGIGKITANTERFSVTQLFYSLAILWILLICLGIAEKLKKALTKNQRNYEALSNLKRDYEQLRVASRTDSLTQTFNRLAINELSAAIERSNTCEDYAVLMFDVDKFKNINDNYGHDAGDFVLKELSRLILSSTRENDTFGRWGGEEFVLICQVGKPSTANKLAEKLRILVAEHHFSYNNLPIKVSVSIGATNWQHNENFNKCLARADAALYSAKINGRNRSEFGEPI